MHYLFSCLRKLHIPLQTKAGYVLVYQRRDQGSSETHVGRQPSAAAGAATILSDSEEMMATTNGEHSDDEMDVN